MSIGITLLVLIIISYFIYKLLQPEKQEIDLINAVIYKIISINRYQLKEIGVYNQYIYIPKYIDSEIEIVINNIDNHVYINEIRMSKSASRYFKREFKKVAINMSINKTIN